MIEVKNLTKFFGENKVVDGVSFTVDKGEILGFLGPNGAGKSTSMRMITGFLPASRGTAVVGGHDVSTDSLSARRLIGYLPENAPVYHDMPVTSFLRFVATIRGFSGKERNRVVDRTIERAFLTDVRTQAVGTLSKGFKQRVCFAQSILHDPEYLIFDEPTDGLDPNQKHEVRTIIREMGRTKAIILSTHILEEVDAVCTRAIIIAKGKVVADDTPEGLRALSRMHGAVRVSVSAPEGGGDALKALSEIPGADRVVPVEGGGESGGESGGYYVFPEKGVSDLAERVLGQVNRSGLSLISLSVEKGRLDEVFRTITTKGNSTH